jgi:hypothetical protein
LHRSPALEKPDVQKALALMSSVDHLINALMSVTHPAQFEAAVKVCNATVRERSLARNILNALSSWSSLCTGASWMFNRITPPHRDNKGFVSGFDYLLTLGGNHAVLKAEDLGIEVKYRSGCVVAIAGRPLLHEVPRWGTDDRVCAAYWIRRSVFQKYGIETLAWSTVKRVKDVLGLL